jgi:F-type H+-transporting ATPase subunit gamma
MPNLRDIRKRRKGAANTRKITRTMELVSSAKLKKAQDAANASYPFARTVFDLLRALASAMDSSDKHQLMRERPVKRVLIYLMASDRGLCGAFNANLVATALQRAKHHRALGREVRFVALGKKGASNLAFVGETVHATHTGIVGNANSYGAIQKLADEAIGVFTSGEVDQVDVVFARFISAGRQEQRAATILPAGGGDGDGADEVVAGVTGARRPAATGTAARRVDYIFNEPPEELFAVLVPRAVRAEFYAFALQTTAAEHAARRVAMKNASDAAADMVKSLNLVYNRGRQGKITQEIAEITGAVEAMA